MQTAFHILSLVKELHDAIAGGTIVGTEFYKKERTALIFVKQSHRVALAFQFHPAKAGVFVVPASKIKMETREKPWPVFKLEGAKVVSIQQLGFDRIFRVDLDHDGTKTGLIFEAIGPNGNLWLVDEKNRIKATLRNREYDPSRPYEPFEITGKLDPLRITASDLHELAAQRPGATVSFLLDKHLLGCTRVLAAEIVKRSGLDEDIEANELDESACANLLKGIEQVVSFFKNPEVGYVYQIRGVFESLPFKLSSSEKQPEKFKTLSLAVMMSTEIRQEQAEKKDDEKTAKDAVTRAIKRLEKRLVKLDQDIAKAADFDTYRRYAELLQINFDKLKRGMSEVKLEDVYSHEADLVSIAIDPALSPQENVEQYFKKYRKGREGLDLLERRREITVAEAAELKQLQNELNLNFENARQRFAGELASLMPSEGVRQGTVERLPYKEYQLSTGLTIFVGRDGSDNDRTTFDFAKPFELWFHTQQCPGSHVVMKYPNKSFQPSRREIEETASIAAFFSKAKNDSLVPVIYTEKRYVRKPRKAKPGLVTVEREKSVMVAPTKPPQ